MTPDLAKPSNPEPASPATAQGEGDYQAARRHRASVKRFVDAGKVEEAARDAAPKTAVEGQALLEAERDGEDHSKGEDPASKHSPVRQP